MRRALCSRSSRLPDVLEAHPAYFHIDAAQGFGKDIETLRHGRMDLISVSGHKIHAPKGIGALIARRRRGSRPPLTPLAYGGGQERGLRPGPFPCTWQPGWEGRAELALQEGEQRHREALLFRSRVLQGLMPLSPMLNGDPERTWPSILNISVPGFDAETGDRGLEGSGGRVGRRGVHFAILHMQSCSQRHGPFRRT